MLAQAPDVVIGVDSHKHTPHHRPVSATAAVLGYLTLTPTPRSIPPPHRLRRRDQARTGAVEGTGSFGRRPYPLSCSRERARHPDRPPGAACSTSRSQHWLPPKRPRAWSFSHWSFRALVIPATAEPMWPSSAQPERCTIVLVRMRHNHTAGC